MAKRKGVNVSEAIREYLKANAEIGPKEAAEAISKNIGKKVPSIYVSNVKTMMKAKGKKGKRGRKPGGKMMKAHYEGNGLVAVDTLLSLKALVRSVGAQRAHSLIDLLA